MDSLVQQQYGRVTVRARRWVGSIRTRRTPYGAIRLTTWCAPSYPTYLAALLQLGRSWE